jgi:hypothetical protein
MKSGFYRDQELSPVAGGEDAGKVKVSAGDTLGYLAQKLVAGANIVLTESVSAVTIAAATPSLSGHQVADEGIEVPYQPTINFVGNGVEVTDDAAGEKTQVTITRGGIGISEPITSGALNAVAGMHYACNGVTAVTLPEGVQGDIIGFSDYGGTFAGEPLVITAAPGNSINGVASSLTLDRNFACVVLGFSGSRWIILSAEIFNDLGVAGDSGSGTGITDGLKGDIIVSGGGLSWLLIETGVAPGTYVSPSLTVDANGRITAICDNVAVPEVLGQTGKLLSNDGTVATWVDAPSSLPDQTDNNGKFLSTNGTVASWIDAPEEIPSQAGNTGKFLSTDGTAATWVDFISGLPELTNNTGQYLTTDGTTIQWSGLPNYVIETSPPVSATSTGSAGSLAFDGSYLYVCVATNTWLRTPITTW